MTRKPVTFTQGSSAKTAGWGARASWLALLLALLCLQHLGLAHRYAHGVLPPGAHATHPLRVAQGDLLPAHDQAACQLLDHLCVGDAVPTTVIVSLPLQLAPTALPWPVRGVQASEPVPFQARAPPAAA